MAEDPDVLSARVQDLIERGVLHPFDPVYDVALAAIDVGYDRLTRAQRGLFDRVLVPALEGRSEFRAGDPLDRTLKWQPIREAPANQALQLAVEIDGTMRPLVFACRRRGFQWVNDTSRKIIYIRPSHWRKWPGRARTEVWLGISDPPEAG